MAGISRDQFIEKLKEFKIGTSVHYIPINYHPYYRQKRNIGPWDFPVSDSIYKGLVSLPIYSKMTVHDISGVIGWIKQIVESSVYSEHK